MVLLEANRVSSKNLIKSNIYEESNLSCVAIAAIGSYNESEQNLDCLYKYKSYPI